MVNTYPTSKMWKMCVRLVHFGSKRGGVKSRFRKSQYLVWPPPALTHAWQRRLMEEIRRLKSGGCSARRGMTMTTLKFDKMCFSTLIIGPGCLVTDEANSMPHAVAASLRGSSLWFSVIGQGKGTDHMQLYLKAKHIWPVGMPYLFGA